MHALSLEVAERLFFWSNALYVLGALLTLGAAVLIAYERRSQPAFPGTFSRTVKDSLILAPAAVCVLAAVAAICFSGVLLNQQRASLEGYRVQAALELARLRHDTEKDSLAARQSQMRETFFGSAPADPGSLEKSIGFEAVNTGANTRELDLGPGAGDSLRTFEGMRTIVQSAPDDAEASQFADHLLLLLIANGIDARQGKDSSVLHQLVGQPGIHLRYLDLDGGHDLAATLATLLRGHGLQVDVAPSWDLAAARVTKSTKAIPKRDQLLISVGPKPE